MDRAEVEANMVACLEFLKSARAAGKIRHFGLSNESAWGMSEWLRLAREIGAPEPVAIQNEYSLMCRLFDTDLAELCLHEKVGLLAFSPLAAGLLTGKYQNGAMPEGSRRTLNESLGGRWTERAQPAVAAYLKVAQEHGVDPTHMALLVRNAAFHGRPSSGQPRWRSWIISWQGLISFCRPRCWKPLTLFTEASLALLIRRLLRMGFPISIGMILPTGCRLPDK